MDRLTREEIERKRDFLNAAIALLEGMSQQWMDERWRASNDLCDLALQSLSHEAVRDEALEEAARVCDAEAEYRKRRHDKPLSGDTDPTIQAHKQVTAHKLGQTIRTLKREPNAVGQAGQRNDSAPSQEGHAAGPAPAAPDVASMVKRLNDISEGREGRIAHIFKDCREAAALLARLGQGWIPVSDRLPEPLVLVLANFNNGDPDLLMMENGKWLCDAPYNVTHWMPLPPAPGASDD